MAKDILLDENNDLQIVDGDFVIGDNDLQLVKHVLTAFKGEYKNAPTLGVGIAFLKGGQLTQRLKREMKLQLESQGLDLKTVELIGDELKIEL